METRVQHFRDTFNGELQISKTLTYKEITLFQVLTTHFVNYPTAYTNEHTIATIFTSSSNFSLQVNSTFN